MTVADLATPADSLLRQALAAQREGRLAEATDLYNDLLAYDPEQPDALHFLGLMDYQRGRAAQGLTRVEAAVRARPQAADFINNLGTIYLSQGRLNDALRLYARAVELIPANPSFLANLGVALSQAGQQDQAIVVARKALAAHPHHAPSLNVLGNALRQQGNLEAARQTFELLLQYTPDDPEAHYNHGVVLQDAWDMAGARRAYEKAISLQPDVARYHVNHGAALMKLHDVEGAGKSYARALELAPDLAEAHYNYAICLLLQGRVGEGARHYEWRLKVDETSLSKPRRIDAPRWDGTPAPDKTVLLHSEQGLGDMLQFVRLAQAAAAMVGRVIVEVQKPLRQLLQDSLPGITVIAKGDEPPAFDFQLPLMSLMAELKLELRDLPASSIPYLRAQKERISTWRSRLAALPGRQPGDRLIALAWQGNPKAKVDRGRSIPLAQLIPLLKLPGITFVSLQKNDGAEQLESLPASLRARIQTLGDEFDSGPDGFLDTAAVMECVDLVLTTDTSIAHVAGGLGRPTWLMLKKTPDWRWLLERTDCPWYPSMRLFRQREEGDWAGVVTMVAQALAPDRPLLGEALALHQAGRLDEAEAVYRQLLSQHPDHRLARHHLGVIALQRGQADIAETHIRQALLLQPDDVDALANLALSLKAQGRREEAVEVCQRVLALAPQHGATHNNLANLLKSLGQLSQAIEHYRQAIACSPDRTDLIHNLGVALIESGDMALAESALRQAARQAPDNADYHFDVARCLLMSGQWEEGWREYEWRRRMGEFGTVSEVAGPRWAGQTDPRLTLLVHAEQGLGDTLQFVRFVQQARSRVGKVILVVPPQLKALLTGQAGIDMVFGYGEEIQPYHAHIPLLSLPLMLGTTIGTLPSQPYLVARDEARRARWRQWRQSISGPLIGINWQGNPKARADAGRSLHLHQLASLSQLQGVTFVALQKGAALEQMSELPPGLKLVLPPEPFDSGADAFMDTAALMAELDLVLTTDTSVAHLAGALGRPCWVMLKHCPDWRWMLGRADSPWYPNTRLFRQSEPGGWSEVIRQVTAALKAAQQPQRLEQALTLHRAGRTAEALAVYQALLASEPGNHLARHYLGVCHYQLGNFTQAEQEITSVLEMRPDYAEALGNLALVYKSQARTSEAEATFARAVQLAPDNADIRNNYGNLLNGLKRHEAAIAQYQQAIRLQPNRADSYQNMGNALGDCERYEEAIAAFRRSLALRPGYVGALNGLGKAYRMQGNVEAAIAVFKEALELAPDNADCWSNLGVCHRELRRYDEAMACYDRALALRPDHAESWSNRAIALHYSGRLNEAEAAYGRSLELKPDRADAHFGLAAVLLTQGKWFEGWREYEWRRQMSESGPVRSFSKPLWDGRSLPRQTLLLFVEQGLGDTLQFLRFLPLIRARVGRIILEIQPALRRLIASAVTDVELVEQGQPLPEFDVYAPLMSVPGLLNLALADLPAPASYLKAEPELIESWRSRLPATGLRVGLNWQGNPKAAVDKGRSVPLHELAPLLDLPGISFVSLQKNAGVEQIEQLTPARQARLTVLGDAFDSGRDAFIDTAAVMASLDLVITSDTAMAHLAGALGVPCWVMLKFMPDWRWLLGRTDCPWYPSARLFRQQAEGDWTGVTAALVNALGKLR